MRFITSIFFGLFFVFIAIGQSANHIFCKVLASDTKEAVSYATVRFQNEKKGVIADEKGEFRLPIQFKVENKKINISAIGFETKEIDISKLLNEKSNLIFLEPKVESLDAVELKWTNNQKREISNPEDIVREAIFSIPKNYPRSHYSIIGYYRDYQLVKDKYFNLNESILESFDSGFHTNKFLDSSNVTALYSYGLNKNFHLDSLLLKSVYGYSKAINRDESALFITAKKNELEILNLHDAIRNYKNRSFSFVDVFRYDFTRNHFFKLKGVRYFDNVPLYEITFQSRTHEDAKFKSIGTIYISKDNYAIYRFEYKMFENDVFNQYKVLSAGHYSYKKPESTLVDTELREDLKTIYEVKLEYLPFDDKMYLNYITFNNRFIIKEPSQFNIIHFEFDPDDQAFYVTFNKSVDESTIKRRSRTKIYYRNKKLIIKKKSLISSNVMKIEVVNWSGGQNVNLSKIKPEDFSYKFKKIKDMTGLVLDKETILVGFQYREFFTQEIFKDSRPPSSLFYVDKEKPLSESETNKANFDINNYWVNSPLRTKGESN